MTRGLWVVVAGLALLSGSQLWAHHSHAATYFQGETTSIAGAVKQVSIRNPHSWVHVDVTEPGGETAVWAIEWAGGAQLNRANVNPRTLRIGDEVTILGNPPRDPNQKRLRMLVIERPSDGWSWGNRPDEVVD